MVKQFIQNLYQQKDSRDRRVAKGMVVAVSCEIVAIDDNDQQKGTYKVQSENDVNKYYTVKFMDGTPVYCSCKDFEIQFQKNRNHICKHQRAIVLAEYYGMIVVGVTKQQQNSKNQNIEPSYSTTSTTTSNSNIKKQESKSYKDDDYSF